MKKVFLLFFFIAFFVASKAQMLNYSFLASSGVFTPNATPTSIVVAGSDDVLSSATAIGFNFSFGCNTYTQFVASSNGWLTLNTAASSSTAFNSLDPTGDFSSPSDRPIIAPLWDDLKTGSGGNVNYKLTGIAPYRVLTIEWKQLLWNYSQATWALSFQVKLSETTNVIQFVYSDNGSTTANVASAAASIGFGLSTIGDFYSLNGSGTGPSSVYGTETNTISTKPATNQLYSWTPVQCSGIPTAGTPASTPITLCTSGTATLSLTGGSTGCGLSYQWQSSVNGSTGWTNVTGATSATQTVTVPAGGLYYKCVITCSNGGATATTSTVNVAVIGIPTNDACASAISLGTVSTTTTIASSNICATADQTSTCHSPTDNVWYKFTIPSGGGSYAISVIAGTMIDPCISLYSGACGSLTSINCTYGSSTNASISGSCLAAGTYYINVDDDFGTEGTFSITVTQTIAGTTSSNDDCVNAISITAGNCVNGDVSCATQSQVGCLGTANDDIWYKFIATNTTMEINIAASSSFDPVVQIFSGTCGSLVSMYCDDADFTTGGNNCKAFTGFTIGNTYYTRVYDYGSGVPTTTTFTMCVVSGAPAANVCNLNYSYTSIATNIEAGVSNSIPGIYDDVLSNVLPIGFTFCYDGYKYTQVYISSNAALVFDAVDPCNYPNVYQPRIAASNGSSTGYRISGPIPTTTDYAPQNAILGPWHDIDVANGGAITYAILGTAPNRRFVVYFNAVHQFESASPCQNAGYEFTGQMKLYETSNNIEIHVQNQKSCVQWNNGQAILGLQNAFGTMAVVPTGYNANAASPYNQYSITNKAWQFTTPCTSCIPIVLPIEIISFTGALNGKEVDLKWSTASETNNAYFTIERSADGKNFEEVARVNGAGNSSQKLDYLTVDNKPLIGISYYRLSQTDFNGSTTRFNIIAVKNTDDDGKFTAIPNPTEGIVNITYSCDVATTGTLKLYDSNGGLVLSKDIACINGQNNSQLDLSEITPGIYMITFSTDTQFYRAKLMKR